MLRVLVIGLLALRCFPHPVPAALCWWRLGGGTGGGSWCKFIAQTLLSTGFMLGLASGAERGEKLGHRSLSLLFLVASLAATDSISPWGGFLLPGFWLQLGALALGLWLLHLLPLSPLAPGVLVGSFWLLGCLTLLFCPFSFSNIFVTGSLF